MPEPSEIVAHITSVSGARITRIVPCHVTIGRQAYPAARYTEHLMTPENTPAWHRGEREYDREAIYCVGPLPASKIRGNVVYRIKGEPDEWYISCYFGDVKARKQDVADKTDVHPFGNMFMLSPWRAHSGEKIDAYDRVPYRRVRAVAHIRL